MGVLQLEKLFCEPTAKHPHEPRFTSAEVIEILQLEAKRQSEEDQDERFN